MTQATGVFLTGGPTAALPTQQRQRRGVLAPVIGLVALGICGLVVLGLVGTSVGLGGVVVGALCALLPVGPVVAAFLWIDRWEPEPPRLLLIAFLWGACFAALGALIINSSARARRRRAARQGQRRRHRLHGDRPARRGGR